MNTQHQPLTPHSLRAAIRQLDRGGVIAYPTEAVFGLGCDPDNNRSVQRILELKGRPAEKGLILIAADFEQLLPYIDITDIPDIKRVLKTWPGPVTWLIKARPTVPPCLRGRHDTLAVRVTAHPVASLLSRKFGKPIVATSANPAGSPPAKSVLKTRLYFGHADLLIVREAVGNARKPTAIFDSRTFARLR
jgi:L-threonylcarbamoyladenylate synthase